MLGYLHLENYLGQERLTTCWGVSLQNIEIYKNPYHINKLSGMEWKII